MGPGLVLRPLKIAEPSKVSARNLRRLTIWGPGARALGAAWCAWSSAARAEPSPYELPPPGHPRVEQRWVQYGAALVSEGRAKAGDICPQDATAPCILGSGGGLALRLGRRSHEGWYLGGAYEFSKQNASNLLRLPILQQARGEARYYLIRDQRIAPYASGALGFAVYGPQWGVETYGPLLALGGGVEFETSRGVFFGLGASYRVIRLAGWRDKANQERPDSFAHFIALELTMEVRTPVARW